MASFDSLVKDILPYVPNCPDSLIESTLRSACIEFAERSKAYVYDLDPISPRSLELNYSDWRNKTSVPQVYLQKTPDAFWVIPIPGSAVANGIQLSVALKPSRTTSNIDTTFSNSYRDGIVYGTLYRLMRIPAKDWTDPAAAADYLGLFNQEIVQAELKARGGDLGVKRTVKYSGAGLSPRKRYKKYGSEIDY